MRPKITRREKKMKSWEKKKTQVTKLNLNIS